MSRRRNKRNREAERDASVVPILDAPRALERVVRREPLVSDRRLFHPEQVFEPPFSPRRSQRRLVEKVGDVVRQPQRRKEKVRVSKWSRSLGFRFAVPRKVELCVRRKQRREVLFALRRTGKGSRSRRHRNYWSEVHCR